MVGYTHEDIDQLFSCISRHLAKINVLTLQELIRVDWSKLLPILKSFTSYIHV